MTHSAGRLEGLADALSAYGLTVTHHPLIETVLLPSEQVWADAEALLEAEQTFLAGLPERDRARLADLLRTLLAPFSD